MTQGLVTRISNLLVSNISWMLEVKLHVYEALLFKEKDK